jgi:hypothetical protein
MARASLASFVFGWLVVLAASVLPAPSRARACSGFDCQETALLPPDGGAVPENNVELIWRRSAINAGEIGTELHLYALEGGARRELAFTLSSPPGPGSGAFYRVVPRRALAAGTEVVVEADEVCDAEGASATSSFRVAPAAPLPSSLGKLESEYGNTPLELWVFTGECYRPHQAAWALLRVTLSESARPYADLLRYEMHVDGQPFSTEEAQPDWRSQPPRPLGGSVLGRGVDRIYSVCETPDPFAMHAPPTGFSRGTHRVQMFAFTPDGTRLASDELDVDLRCPVPADFWPPPGNPPSGLSGVGADAAVDAAEPAALPDAGQSFEPAPAAPPDAAPVSPLEAGASIPDDSIDPDSVQEPSARRASAHCSPLIGARTGRPLLWVLFVLLISIVASRTKRRLRAPGSARQTGPDAGAGPASRL